ncbi:RecQ family ATP-dependent DNA helicase [Arcobacter porcinus]|uniref:DNA 3'-5' helicase n=1 Tax=Arcobacter porcinus TaxID=1935204 RepID=A0ABX2YF09_9BACT|nr:RecQ family ATP-dependent DNA helicase [Arcobacter porcinus]OCL93452.1 ATP-dependent DNA helicase RecQ [Arcobacter porcinus]
MIKAIIFDLDLTIFNSSPLKDLMRNRSWDLVYKNIPNCKFYDNSINTIKHLRNNGIKVIIFTNSPKKYVSEVLNFGSIEVDYIISYYDVQNHKPHPEGVYKTMQNFSLSNKELLYIGDSNVDYETAKNARVSYFNVEWGETTYQDINKVNYTNFFSILQNFNFLQDISQTESYNPKNQTEFTDIKVLKSEQNKLFLGYYRHDKDNVKNKVLKFKDGDRETIDKWLSVIKQHIDLFPDIDYIVRALGHKETTANDSSLDNVGRLLEEEIVSAKYLPDLLSKKNTNNKLTTMNAIDRKNTLSKQYFLNKNHIDFSKQKNAFLIIDDVYTTGSTTKEITRAIREVSPNSIIYIFTLVQTKGFGDSHEIELHNQNLLAYLNKKITLKKNDINYKTDNYENKKFSANYTYSNHNFIIQNLLKNNIASNPNYSKYIPAIYVIRNILQRGKPTLTSKYIQSKIGTIHTHESFFNPKALISKEPNKWQRTIKGDSDKNYYPANKFLYELWPKYFAKDYANFNSLIIPEVKFEDITFVYDENLKNQQVDFYFPQASLIIEIDGKQHQDSKNDEYRDNYLKKYGLIVVRISTKDLELENNSFRKSIEDIRTIIYHRIKEDEIRKNSNQTIIGLGDYLNPIKNLDDKNLIATAIIRTQLLILELLERKTLEFDKDWNIELKQNDVKDFIHIAINDLFIWFDNIFKLLKLKFKKPKIDIKIINSNDNFSHNDYIKIDFSLLSRYSDEFQTNPNVIYIRTDYFDEYKFFDNSDSSSLRTAQYKEVDYFQISTIDPINYILSLNKNGNAYKSLKFLLENIFLQNIPEVDFREGQFNIIANALMRNDTVGLLPTGSGKSICYQLACILQPSISFVVCPIKSLMYDQKDDLDKIFFSRTNYITSDLNASEKTTIQREFARGKYFFIFISPERFQSKAFRQEFNSINEEKSFAYAVIDEVHCLSEWGHDFRTSYLNLANVISKLATNSTYIGLTATASINVLRDIQIEFNIDDVDVKTPSSFTREELSFNVINDYGNKFNSLVSKILSLHNENKVLDSNGENSKCGIIFTPHVNGTRGCYDLANNLSSKLGVKVGYYSGSKPKNNTMAENEFDEYKRDIQNKFKSNEFTLLTATKAFGMGINKGNIFYTIHYGLPNSMESFYQEGGRAGRDKSKFKTIKAECTVLLTPEQNDENYKNIWNPEISLDDLANEVRKLSRNGDLNSNFFMLTNGLDTINSEFKLIKDIYTSYYSENELSKLIKTSSIGNKKHRVEKSIYRLSQLGVVDDWTVENFYTGEFEVQFKIHSEDDVKSALLENIRKYDSEFIIEDSKNNVQHQFILDTHAQGKITTIEKYILILLIWTYQHFVGNRKQSMKNVYDNCKDFSENKINADELKLRLENYFKINKTSHSLQFIADNPNDYTKWFEILFKSVNGKVTDELITKQKRQQLKDQLSRFLESYINNSGLNFISGILRLYENEFNDQDGKPRLINSLEYIKSKFDKNEQTKFIESIITISRELNNKQKEDLVKVIHQIFKDKSVLLNLNKNFNDEYSKYLILQNNLSILKKINQRLKDNKWDLN